MGGDGEAIRERHVWRAERAGCPSGSEDERGPEAERTAHALGEPERCREMIGEPCPAPRT